MEIGFLFLLVRSGDIMTQTNLFSIPNKAPQNEESVYENAYVIHDKCNAKANFELFGGCKLPTYYCPVCRTRVNCKAVIYGVKGWTVL